MSRPGAYLGLSTRHCWLIRSMRGARLCVPRICRSWRRPARVVAGLALTVGSVSISHLKSSLVSLRSRPGSVNLTVVRQVAVAASPVAAREGGPYRAVRICGSPGATTTGSGFAREKSFARWAGAAVGGRELGGRRDPVIVSAFGLWQRTRPDTEYADAESGSSPIGALRANL